MPSEHSPKSPPGPEGSHYGGPRWFMLDQPRVYGMATYEWNVTTGQTWFSEEWGNIVQDAYDWTIPSNQDWWTERVHPEDMPLLLRALLAIHAGFVDRYELTCRLKRPDGSWRLVLFRSQVTVKTSEGAPWLLSGVAIDLTGIFPDGCEIPRAATVTELDYLSMLENSPDLFVRFDRDLEPVYANPALDKYLGGRRKSFVYDEKQVNRRLAGDYRELFQKNIGRVFTEQTVVREEVCASMTDGSEIVGECSFWPEFGTDGKVRFAMVQFRDITARRRAEQRAALDEKRLEALYRLTLMENAEEDEVLRFVMESVLELTDSRSGFFFIPEEEGADRGKLFWSGDHYRNIDWRYLPDGHLPRDLIQQMTDRDGNRVYRSINNSKGRKPLYVIFDGEMAVMRGIIAPGMEGNRMVCVAGVCNRDSDYDESDLQQFETFINSAWLILRRRRFVRELQRAKEAAETANKAKNVFLANVSHELRTPLNGVLSMLQLMDSSLLPSEQYEYLQTAQASGKALLRIISDILDYSSMESGKMPLAVDFFDFQSSVRSALGMFKNNAAAKGVKFVCRIDPAIPRRLLGDEARVRQIIFNLVGNAVKFTAEGSITVACSLLPENDSKRARVSITVEDTGIGIPQEKLAGIFDAFSQVEGSHRRKYAGTGLGLSIVKHLASMMNGSVSLESREGEGTTVSVTLAFESPPARQRRQSGFKPAKKPVPEWSLNILVAEDDHIGSMAIRKFLEHRGHRVLCVEDGSQALEALQLYPFHCLFTDITMPAMDGLELVRRIRTGAVGDFPPSKEIRNRVREIFPDAPPYIKKAEPVVDKHIAVIAVSAHSMIGDRERFIGQGMDHYVSKPIDRVEIDEALLLVGRHLGKM